MINGCVAHSGGAQNIFRKVVLVGLIGDLLYDSAEKDVAGIAVPHRFAGRAEQGSVGVFLESFFDVLTVVEVAIDFRVHEVRNAGLMAEQLVNSDCIPGFRHLRDVF